MALRLFTLDGRLMACARMLTGGHLADIGTDHGYLPVWAVQQGLCSRAVAADINPGPLEAARRNIERYGLADKISLRLSDGLREILPGEADDIVIAGMGGELIARILGNASWVRAPGKTLILQPMSKEEVLRRYLQQAGFTVQEEQAAQAGGKVYTVMQAVYTGVSHNTDALFPVIGLLRGKNEAQRLYLSKKAEALRRSLAGEDEAGKQRLYPLIETIEELAGGTYDDHR